MQKTKLKVVSFNIRDTSIFPDEYKYSLVEVAVWPVMPHVLDVKGGLERLEDWAINNILLGFVEGDYTEADLREDVVFIKVVGREGKVLLDTFDWGGYFERDSSDTL